jgi:DNA-binding transcriptional LysR family regulator
LSKTATISLLDYVASLHDRRNRIVIDLVALQSLTAVAARGTVGAAAEALGYTPSAVSQQIKRLERDLGLDLLERVGRGVVLTEQARLLVTEGGRLLEDVEAVESRLHSSAGRLQGSVRMVAHATAIRGIVAPMLGGLSATAPDITVSLVERDPADGVDLLMSGQVDLAVVHNWVGVPLHVPTGVVVRPIGEDHADLLVRRSDRLARRPSVTARELLDETWASTPVGTICHAWFRQMFAGFTRSPDVSYWAPEFSSHIALVEAGVAVALVPRLGRGALPAQVVAVPVRDPVPTRQILVLCRATMASSPVLQHISDELARVAATALRKPPSRRTANRSTAKRQTP